MKRAHIPSISLITICSCVIWYLCDSNNATTITKIIENMMSIVIELSINVVDYLFDVVLYDYTVDWQVCCTQNHNRTYLCYEWNEHLQKRVLNLILHIINGSMVVHPFQYIHSYRFETIHLLTCVISTLFSFIDLTWKSNRLFHTLATMFIVYVTKVATTKPGICVRFVLSTITSPSALLINVDIL